MPDRSVTYTFRGNFAGLTAGLSTAGRNVQEFGGKLTALDKNGQRMRSGLTELSGTAGRVGLVLGGAFALMTAKAADFEQAMSFVQAATHETAANMDELRQAALDAGQATAFSATEAAGAIEELAKAGVSTEQILGGGLSGALDLAAAGGLDVAKAAEAAASAMTQFGLSGEQVPHVADLLSAGAGKAQGSVEDLSMALNQSGLVAAQTGLSIEETTGALAAFASAGLLGSDAGTSFKQLLLSLTPSSKQAADLMKELGISAYDAQGNFIGLTDFADNLRAGLVDLSVEQQNAALKTIFGADAIRAASILYEQGGKGIQSWIDKTNDSGYAAETAAIRMDNLKGDLEQLGGALETLFIGGGEGQTGFLRELTQGATNLINVFNELPGPIKSISGGLLGLTAIGAGGFWFTSKAITTIAETKTALAALGVSSDSVRRKLTLLNAVKFAGLTAAAAVAIPLLSNDLDTLSRSMGNAKASTEGLDGILEALNKTNVGKYADDLGINMQKLAEDLYANGESGAYVAETFDLLNGKLDSFGDNAKEAITYWLPGITSGQNKAAEVNNGLNKVIAENSKLLGTSAEDARKAAVEQANLAGVNLTLADAAGMSAEQIELTGDQLEAIQKAASETSSSFLGFTDSLNNSKVSLTDWIGEMEKQARALREFTKNSKKAAKEGLDEGLIQSLQDAGAEGALRMEQLANASDSEIKRANRAFRSGQSATDAYAQAVEDLARAAAGLPPNPRMDVSVTGVDAGLTKLRDIINQAKQIPREIRTNYIVNQINRANKIGAGEAGPGAGKKASGGLVTGPGGPTDDMIPTWLSNREYVVKASAVQKYGVGFFDAVNAERLASGGQPGRKDKGSILITPGVGALAELDQLPKSLKSLIKWVDASSDALQGEISARQSLSDSLSSAVSGKITSDLFGSTDVWSMGGTFEDVMARLNGDIASGNALSANIAALQGKGLNGPALDALLAQGDSATIANFAALSAAQLDQYEQTYQVRADLAASVGAQAAAAAGYTAELVAMNAKHDQEIALLKQLNGIQSAAPDKTGKAVGKHNKRGAGNASRNIKRG